MIYLILFFSLMLFFVIKIEKKIIGSKYLIKRAHKYRHQTRKERVERRKEIEEYKKSITHKYYLDKNLKDPEIKRMLEKNKNKSLNAFRFEARLFYYGFVISILFGFIFTITGLYQDEFIRSLYPYIQPYFKVFYSNFDRYTFNPLSFKVCFSWVLVFSVIICLIFVTYYIRTPKDKSLHLKNIISLKSVLMNVCVACGGIFLSYLIFTDTSHGFHAKTSLYNFHLSYGIYFILNSILFVSLFSFLFLVLNKFILIHLSLLKGKPNVN